MVWLFRSRAPCEQDNHLLVGIWVKGALPSEYLKVSGRSGNLVLSEAGKRHLYNHHRQ